MTPRLKPGPRPKRASERRSVNVGVRFTPAEYERLKRVAGRYSVGTWVRVTILDALEGKGARRT